MRHNVSWEWGPLRFYVLGAWVHCQCGPLYYYRMGQYHQIGLAIFRCLDVKWGWGIR